MHLRTIVYSLIAAISMTAVATAQQSPPEGGYPPSSNGNVRPVSPDQPVQPQLPTLERRDVQPGMQQPGMEQPGMPQPGMQQPPRRQPPPPPFTLTPQEQDEVDRVLYLWEDRNRKVKTFDCRFKRWTYNEVWGPPNQPRFVELGVLRYAAPDRGMFRVDTADNGGQEAPIDPRRAEHWICDGKSIIEFSHPKKQVIVHKLPPELQGKEIADSPLPFLFGSEAKKLKERFFLRVVTPRDVQGQIWIEAYPRHQQQAADFHHAQFIITAQGMAPYALKLIQPNPKNYLVYQFYEIVINEPLRIFRSDPFRPVTPFGWQKIVEEPQGAQARRPPNDGRR